MTDGLTAEVLTLAARVMEQRGLCQWAYTDESGAVCVLGAIAVARGHDPEDSVMVNEFVEEPLAELAVLMGCDPVVFSDETGRTATDVAAALRIAAASLSSAATTRTPTP